VRREAIRESKNKHNINTHKHPNSHLRITHTTHVYLGLTNAENVTQNNRTVCVCHHMNTVNTRDKHIEESMRDTVPHRYIHGTWTHTHTHTDAKTHRDTQRHTHRRTKAQREKTYASYIKHQSHKHDDKSIVIRYRWRGVSPYRERERERE